jgi:predicted Zn-dependent protease
MSPYNTNAIMVKRVGEKLSEACEAFLRDHSDISRIAGFEWEFNLVQDAQKNAWCMPGGKVVVYEGILSTTQDETGLAVVLSHEIAHAIARHGNERVSQQMLSQYGGSAVQVLLGSAQYQGMDLSGLILNAYSKGAELGMLKFSRNQESEADKMGLVFMEYAGYNSEMAIDFWKRMSADGGGEIPFFMSTHPTDQQRISDIEAYIPIAKSYVKL